MTPVECRNRVGELIPKANVQIPPGQLLVVSVQIPPVGLEDREINGATDAEVRAMIRSRVLAQIDAVLGAE